MPFQIIEGDITTLEVDSIVNSTSSEPFIFGGLDAQIHALAGPELLKARAKFGTLKLSQPVITEGYNLRSKKVIHVVGPIYKTGRLNEATQLKETYQHVLELAIKENLESIAFPLISSGVYRYPKKEALEIALGVIKTYAMLTDMLIYLVVYDAPTIVDKLEAPRRRNELSEEYFIERSMAPLAFSRRARSLDDLMDEIDETFQEMLFRWIDQKGLDDVTVYKRANIDRKLFSKIRSNRLYQPSKPTVLALAVALELSRDETIDLLNKAGYTLSDAIPLDIIVGYYIDQADYDIYKINLALYERCKAFIGSI